MCQMKKCLVVRSTNEYGQNFRWENDQYKFKSYNFVLWKIEHVKEDLNDVYDNK